MHVEIGEEGRPVTRTVASGGNGQYIVTFDGGAEASARRLGGKCCTLLAMTRAGVDAYLAELDTSEPAAQASATAEVVGAGIRRLMCEQLVPPPVAKAVRAAYDSFCTGVGQHDAPVAVRSSASAEDLPGASFAGQHDTYLWIQGADAVLDAVRRCWASLWTSRAIIYRAHNAVPEKGLAMGVGVQKMIDARVAPARSTRTWRITTSTSSTGPWASSGAGRGSCPRSCTAPRWRCSTWADGAGAPRASRSDGWGSDEARRRLAPADSGRISGGDHLGARCSMATNWPLGVNLVSTASSSRAGGGSSRRRNR